VLNTAKPRDGPIHSKPVAHAFMVCVYNAQCELCVCVVCAVWKYCLEYSTKKILFRADVRKHAFFLVDGTAVPAQQAFVGALHCAL
jgi:hypothetical protein